jgi:predicted transcriptional regulator
MSISLNFAHKSAIHTILLTMSDYSGGSQELIELYNEVDAFMRQQYKQDKFTDHAFLITELSPKNRVIARHQQEMRAVAQIRNSIVHSSFAHLSGPILEPNPDVIKRYRNIRDALLHPANALSIAIPAQNIYTATQQTNIIELLRSMNEHIYTHVPIMDGDELIGILSENTLLSYIAEAGEVVITKDMTVADFKDHIPLTSHASEVFVFLPRDVSLSQIFEIFNKAIHKHERIGMVFITEHGKESEKPLGILTAWDLASPEFELG